MDAKKFSILVLCIVMSSVYVFAVWNAFIGLLDATVTQGFAGLILMISATAMLLMGFANVDKLFK